MTQSVYQLKCYCNTYSWGKKAHESLAARYCAQTPGTDFKVDDNVEYAEMWMGTYPTIPSYVLGSGENLQDVLNANKDGLIGENVLAKYGCDLPFLPKVLSIAKAAPLQLHPNKRLASKLHKEQPDKFPDSNHKPEIAIALSDFELFVGFKPFDAIGELFRLDILQRFLPNGTNSSEICEETLRSICSSMLTAPETVVRTVEEELQNVPKESLGQHAYILDLLPRLQERYSSSDNGALVALLCMNYMNLEGGKAIFVPEDSIHAYLSGDIIECMARSDNVLSTGFCPRADRDSVDIFANTLSFTPHDANAAMLPAKKSYKGNGKTLVYAPAAGEFNVLVTTLMGGGARDLQADTGP